MTKTFKSILFEKMRKNEQYGTTGKTIISMKIFANSALANKNEYSIEDKKYKFTYSRRLRK